MRINRQGFTLTEVLLVSSMFVLISLAVFNAFSNGLKLWARGEHVIAEGYTAIFLDKIAEDVRQTVLMGGILFKGRETEVSFPAIILAPTDGNGSRAKEEIGTQLGAIRYAFVPYEKKIFRYQATYGQALKGQWSSPVEVADLIEGMSMRYYFKTDRGLDVKDETDKDIPFGVMIDVQFLVEGKIYHMRRLLIIPIGGAI
jgi:prepilin-type N-terminal cleavage/methylation domain-containing protein